MALRKTPLSAEACERISRLADRCVRYLTATFPQVSRCPHCFQDLIPPRNQFYGDQQMTGIRVHIGVLGIRAGEYGMQDARSQDSLLHEGHVIGGPPLTAAATAAPQSWDDKTTQPMLRLPLPDLGDE